MGEGAKRTTQDSYGYIQPTDPPQAACQDTLPMVAVVDGMTRPCLQVKGEFCQGLIWQTMPSDHPCSSTCSELNSTP